LVALLALGVPTGQRADRQSIVRADAILAQATRCSAKHIVLATDSPTLNLPLVNLALELSPAVSQVKVDTLAWQTMSGVPIEQDYQVIDEADAVVFQDKEKLLPPFTNQRAPEYELYIRQKGHLPVRIMEDLSVYEIHCRR
jgi:hypothetical protein